MYKANQRVLRALSGAVDQEAATAVEVYMDAIKLAMTSCGEGGTLEHRTLGLTLPDREGKEPCGAVDGINKKYEDWYLKRGLGARGAAIGELPSSADSKPQEKQCGGVAGKSSHSE